MIVTQSLERLASSQDLSESAAARCFDHLFSGQMSPAQSGAFLLGLRVKGATSQEMAAAVHSALKHSRQCPAVHGRSIDTCGTGGDGKKSFNCSTAVSFFLAHMGYQVVKHGNRAVSSACGSADVIEAMNIPFAQTAEEVHTSLAASNFAFLFAPSFHPALAHIAPIRKDLGIPTLFNLMGPLLNPARPTHQLLGVGDPRAVSLVADVLARSGVQAGAVVHGAKGFDELTPCGVNTVIMIRNGRCTPADVDPAGLGIPKCSPDQLAAGDKETALHIMRDLLQGRGTEAVKNMVALNLGLALSLLDQDPDLAGCVRRARQVVDRGVMTPIGAEA
ncbi:anthranilate phosphoribosyltransferase [Desulfovermiculus halophilus]|jgi:anthranilate phosphoribosyltransferase|uniref:anthranilate phosphoribosyltransferase n=1 Tax=Desulfovermiculus halophilus TaxID=339722 RepID=UPI000487E7C9|nr:anthranilate phosphoribosyltransferase [Desulfovermiculus halophilus]